MFRVGHSVSAGQTPAFALIVEGWNELVQAGYTLDGNGVMPVDEATEVLFAEDETDREIVGVLCFKMANGVCRVLLGYVEETSRLQGVYRQLWDNLLGRCKEAGVFRLHSQEHVENRDAQAVMRKFDRAVSSVVYETILG